MHATYIISTGRKKLVRTILYLPESIYVVHGYVYYLGKALYAPRKIQVICTMPVFTRKYTVVRWKGAAVSTDKDYYIIPFLALIFNIVYINHTITGK